MRPRTATALLTIACVWACAGRAPSEDLAADASGEFSPADFAAANLDLAPCPPPPSVDATDVQSHAVAPDARLRLPIRFAAEAGGGEVQRWSDGANASVEIWHTSEPAEGMAVSGSAMPVGDITQCELRVAGAFAKMYALAFSAPGEPDTTYLALVYVYPQVGLAFNITIEAGRKAQRDSLIAFASTLTYGNELICARRLTFHWS